MNLATRVRQVGFALRYWSRMRRGRSAVISHLQAPRPDNLPMPTFVQLRLTNLCNLRCKTLPQRLGLDDANANQCAAEVIGSPGTHGLRRKDVASASATVDTQNAHRQRPHRRELHGGSGSDGASSGAMHLHPTL